MNDGEALNMGLAEHMEHDRRYDRADEFMDVVVGHWNSWDDDAIVLDKTDRAVRASAKRCGGWIMWDNASARAARSPCRGRRKGSRW